MKVVPFLADALGDSSYLVLSGQVAAVIDPQRDVRPCVEAAAAHGVSIVSAVETHVHNDYISGALELAALGAEVVAPAGSELAFPHRELADMAEVAVGGARLRAMATPGHTFEHTAYLLLDERGKSRALFSGGAIVMGAAGRTDLLGPKHTKELTRLQFESARRLADTVPAVATVYPTHGAGSFCSSTTTFPERHGPLAVEHTRNRLYVSPSFEAFRMAQLERQMPIPAYYHEIAPINRRGPDVTGTPPSPRKLAPDKLEALLTPGVDVIDIRSRHDFAAAHVPGSITVEESGSALAYVSWVTPFGAPLALVSYDGQQAARFTTDLWRIGYEDVRGYMPFEAWAGRPTDALPVVDEEDVLEMLDEAPASVLDVRFADEHQEEPLAGARQLRIDRLSEWQDNVPAEPVTVVCESGQRSSTVASVLQRRGVPARVLLHGGASGLRERRGA